MMFKVWMTDLATEISTLLIQSLLAAAILVPATALSLASTTAKGSYLGRENIHKLIPAVN